jgi:hypothetical protein
MAPPVVGYATPAAYQQQAVAQPTAWREGSIQIVPKQATLPDRCAKCNQPMHGEKGEKRFTQKLQWHHPALFLLILAGILLYAIVALIVQKKAAVSVALCPVHAARRFRGLLIGWLCAAVGIGITFLGCAGGMNYAGHDDVWPVFIIFGGILLAIIGGIVGMMMARVFTPQKIDDHFAWLKGAGEEFLSNFPVVQRP